MYKFWINKPSNLYSQSTKYRNKNTMKFEIETIKSSRCDYSVSYILLTGDVSVTSNRVGSIALKNCTPFIRFIIHVNDVTY